jgi:hypothetical protein
MPRRNYAKVFGEFQIGRDGQRQAVYAWDRALCCKWPHLLTPMTTVAATELITRVWADYRPGEVPPNVRVTRSDSKHSWGSRAEIALHPHHHNFEVILHETAHSLLPWGTRHGGVFARLLAELLGRYAGVPVAEAIALGRVRRFRNLRSKRAMVVRFAPTWAVPAPARSAEQRLRRRKALEALDATVIPAQRSYLREHYLSRINCVHPVPGV